MPSRGSITGLVIGFLTLSQFASLASAQLLQRRLNQGRTTEAGPPPASPEIATVEAAGQVLDEIMEIPASGIPRALFAEAEGLVIVPRLLKGGFVVGVRHGRGLLVLRDANRVWQPPRFVSVTGGSFGWQAGIQETDVILVFTTQRSIEGLLQGKLTIGADVAAAAGPLGRQAAAATDLALAAEILSYSRSRGLFAGVALDGSVIAIDQAATSNYYQTLDVNAQALVPQTPPSATALLRKISRYSDRDLLDGGAGRASPRNPGEGLAGDISGERRYLAREANQLNGQLDDAWRKYLALPRGALEAGQALQLDELRLSVTRFESIAMDSKYVALHRRAEFQRTLFHLRRCLDLQTAAGNSGAILPPPPRLDGGQ